MPQTLDRGAPRPRVWHRVAVWPRGSGPSVFSPRRLATGGGGGGGAKHSPGTPTTGLRERGNDTSKSTGRSGRQNAATRRNMRREERGTVQGPVKKQQPDGMSHGGGHDA